MNLNHLSDDELLDYLDRYSEDPIMRRIVDILLRKQQGIISDLVAAGMDPQDWTFCTDHYNHYYPGQYISHLKNEISYIEDELTEYQDKYEEAKDKIKRLEARSVASLITDLHSEINNMTAERDRAKKQRDQAYEENERTKSKMKVWTAISTDLS
jgi:DNA mismatch repair ATPase MutS